MSRLRVALVAFGLGVGAATLGACSSSEQAKPADPVLARGQEVYGANCASCHGQKGQGGLGPNLQTVGERLSVEQETDTITNGRKGTQMQAWGPKLSADDINAVVRYSRESLAKP
jgi:cytochrome c oxidase subunit 2